MNSSLMYKEILMTRDSLKYAHDYNAKVIYDLKDIIEKQGINNIIIAARGSSDNVGNYFKYLCEIFLHIPVTLAACSVVTKYESYLNLEHTMVLAISQSGSGQDICEFIRMANNHGALTVSMTNNLDSICAKESHYKLYLNLTEEKGLAATKTFTSQMYISLLFVAILSDNEELKNGITELDEQIQTVIDSEESIIDIAKACTKWIDCYLLSRGVSYVSSLEGALKIQETTYIKAKAYAISDFYHGPMAITDENQNFILFAAKGVCEQDSIDMFNKLMDAGANVIVITNTDTYEGYEKVINIPDCSEFIFPILSIIAIQLFSCNLSTLRGIDTDHPRLLKKVTVTR